jgi:prophage maintenance system killer protein
MLNGWELEYDPLQAYDFIIGLYETGRMKFDVLAAWLRENARPISPASPEQ